MNTRQKILMEMRNSIIGFLMHRPIKYGIIVCVVFVIGLKFTHITNKSSQISRGVDDKVPVNDDKVPVNDDAPDNNRKGLNDDTVQSNDNDVVSLAKKISLYNNTVLVSIVNDAYLPFAYSWLCNTKNMKVHRSVLVITTDVISKTKLNNDWPDISVFHVELDIPKGDQDYSHVGYVKIMIRRTEMILSLLQAKINLLLLEFDYVWFTNPIYGFQRQSGVDMLVNPVATTGGRVFNGGLLYLFATEKTIKLWTKLTEMMKKLEQTIKEKSDKTAISEGENDQIYLSQLIRERYANISYNLLTLDKYSDGQWYRMEEAERQKLRPLVISNNWVIGNKNKISRAKEWHHWFLRPDGTCDEDAVKKIVYA